MIPDLYHGDPITDWDAFAEGIGGDFCILKATQGDDFIDDTYADRAAECHRRGISHWAYTFFVDGVDPENQAQHLIDIADSPVGLIIDVEDYDGSLASADMVRTAAKYMVDRGYRVGIYFMDSEGDEFGGIASEPDFDATCFSWCARYGANDGTESRDPDHGCSLHQYTSAGDMPGVDGACDLSRITGAGFGLDYFKGGSTNPQPAPQPDPEPDPEPSNSGYSISNAINRGREIIDAYCEYSQDDRWSDDPLMRDCASFVIDCVRAGGIDLDDGYTGSLHDQLCDAGFTPHDYDGNLGDCERGGILLRSRDLHPEGDPPGHTCMVSEGGSRIIECGSTPAAEIDIYDDVWDWFFSPPTDSSDGGDGGGGGGNDDPLDIQYQVHTAEDGWLPVVHALDDYAGVYGHSIDCVAVLPQDGHHIDLQVHHEDDGEWGDECSSDNYNIDDWNAGYAGTFDRFIDGVRFYAHNDCASGERVKYRLHELDGDWYDWQYDYEDSDGQDGYAGKLDGTQVDGLQMC